MLERRRELKLEKKKKTVEYTEINKTVKRKIKQDVRKYR